MKKIFKTFMEVVAILIVIAAIFGAGYYTAGRMEKSEETVVEKEKTVTLPGEVEKRVVTVEDVESKLEETSELTMYSGNYTVTLGKDESRYLLENFRIPGTKNSIEITVSGIVKVGYDISDIKIRVDDDKIYISIPEARLNDNYLIWDTLECSEANSILNPIEFSQYQEIIDEIEEMDLRRLNRREYIRVRKTM